MHPCYSRDRIVDIKKTNIQKHLKYSTFIFYMMLSQNLNFLRMVSLNAFMMVHLMFLVNPHIDLTNKSCSV